MSEKVTQRKALAINGLGKLGLGMRLASNEACQLALIINRPQGAMRQAAKMKGKNSMPKNAEYLNNPFHDEWDSVVLQGVASYQPTDFNADQPWFYLNCDGCILRANSLDRLLRYWNNKKIGHEAQSIGRIG